MPMTVTHRVSNPRIRHAHKVRADSTIESVINAFAVLQRPSPRDLRQIDDLLLPLLSMASAQCRARIAHTLSNVSHAPRAAINSLAMDTVEIAEPVLLNSASLTDLDLVAVIKNGTPAHRSLIAKREGLRPLVVEALAAKGIQYEPSRNRELEVSTPTESLKALKQIMINANSAKQADNANDGLQIDGPVAKPDVSALLALARQSECLPFAEELARLCNIDVEISRTIIDKISDHDLIAAFKFVKLSNVEAFALTIVLRGTNISRQYAINYLRRYDRLSEELIQRTIYRWRKASGNAYSHMTMQKTA